MRLFIRWTICIINSFVLGLNILLGNLFVYGRLLLLNTIYYCLLFFWGDFHFVLILMWSWSRCCPLKIFRIYSMGIVQWTCPNYIIAIVNWSDLRRLHATSRKIFVFLIAAIWNWTIVGKNYRALVISTHNRAIILQIKLGLISEHCPSFQAGLPYLAYFLILALNCRNRR